VPTQERPSLTCEIILPTSARMHVVAFRYLCLFVLLLCQSQSFAQHRDRGTASGGIDYTNLAVIINTADPLSVATGEYYVKQRRIAAAQVIRISIPVGRSELAVDEFVRVKAEVETLTPPAVQAYLLTWSAPYRVGCMSITTAFAFGYDPSFCADGCHPTRLSPYFNSASRSPASELQMRPTMMAAGRSFAQIKALIDRGVSADGTYPQGTAYLLSTSDKARNSRAALYQQVERVAAGLINIDALKADALVGKADVMFYFTGVATVAQLDTLHFIPGAIADHLTSFGGQLTDSGQMSALRWLEAGATGSYGAVVEPCNFPQKFPHPAIVIGRYLRGESLIESYWKSVAWPGQGVFIGEPLAAPYRLRR
jgi:uncharacterized protein (TIGR03790 family)